MKKLGAVLIFVTTVLNLTVIGQTDRKFEREKSTNQTEKRIALVIGNGAYAKAKTLTNPANDAADMAKALQDLGFEVISGVNQNKRQMETLIREFGTKLANSGGVGLFYYAGHGLQVAGENYLVPVDADIPEEDEVSYSAVPISLVLSKMQTAKNDLNIIILDACRNNPFARSWRSFRDSSNNNGLAKISPPTGTLVLYATEPGKVASDGAGRNGLFTEALLKQIKQPNLEYDQMVKALSADVWQKSNKQQLPWKEGNTLQDFYFAKTSQKTKATDDQSTSIKIESTPDNKTTLNNNSELIIAGTVRKNSIGMELVWIPAGKFMMGSSDAEVEAAFNEAKKLNSSAEREWFTMETPKREVTIKKGFWIGKYEVTQRQWQLIMGNNPSKFKNCGENCPVEQVSWDDIQLFLNRLNAKKDGFEYNLPSEAQWEYAARAGTTTVFAFGNKLSSSEANIDGNYPYASTIGTYIGGTVPVGSYQPNAWGLYDTHGNVWEWVQDIWGFYINAPTDGSANTSFGDTNLRVLRGGSWKYSAGSWRSASRTASKNALGDANFGFRIMARSK